MSRRKPSFTPIRVERIGTSLRDIYTRMLSEHRLFLAFAGRRAQVGATFNDPEGVRVRAHAAIQAERAMARAGLRLSP